MNYVPLKILLSPGGRRETIGGIAYAVYPSVILVEGVHHGAIGEPTLYPADVLRKSAAAWNGSPVTVNHPQNAQGAYVSAQQAPDKAIGYLDGVVFQDAKLRGFAFLDVVKANAKKPGIIARLDSGSVTEISTGLYGEEVAEKGMWRGESYASRLTAIQPDHLALLPDGQGACSWQDGCGIRANRQEERAYLPQTIRFNTIGGNNMSEEAYIPPALYQGEQGNISAVNRAIAHINATHGAGATSKVRCMSGAELLLLGESLTQSKQQAAPAPSGGGEEAYVSPVLFGGGAR